MRMLFLLMILVTVLSTHAQVYKYDQGYKLSNEERADILLHRSRQQKTKALVTLIGGAGLATVGMSLYIKEINSGSSSGSDAYYIAYTGIAATLTSIPLFVASLRSKRNAKLLLKNEETALFHLKRSTHIPAIGIRLAL